MPAETVSSAAKFVLTTYRVTSKSGLSSALTLRSRKDDQDKIEIETADGTVRTLLEPAKPRITLSSSAAQNVLESGLKMDIKIAVDKNGSVPSDSVSVTQSEGILPATVAEINTQVSSWLFSAAPADSLIDFKYSIEKK